MCHISISLVYRHRHSNKYMHMQLYFICTHLYISAPPPVLLFVPLNPLKMFQFCPCYVPMETPRKSLNFSHAALVGHQLSRAKRDPPSQQAGSQKNHPILKIRLNQEFANISILKKKYFHLNLTLGWFRLPPSPPWLDGLLAVSLISTLVVGLLRAILRALPL